MGRRGNPHFDASSPSVPLWRREEYFGNVSEFLAAGRKGHRRVGSQRFAERGGALDGLEEAAASFQWRRIRTR